MEQVLDKIVYPGSDRHTADELALTGSVLLDFGDEAIIKADDTAYILFQIPDLQKQQLFLEDFGMQLALRKDDAIYMRGYGPRPYIYHARQGPDARFLGAGFAVRCRKSSTYGIWVVAIISGV